MKRSSMTLIFAGVLAGWVASCREDPLAPFEPEINNATDSFQLQATNVRDVSTTLTYVWRNTGTIANINHSTTATGGSARLVIRAANGTQVYSKLLVPSLNEPTSLGTTGDWTIELVLANYSGTLNFRVQKP